MMKFSKLIPVKGEPIDVRPKNGKCFELKELQKAVDGYIEIIHLTNSKVMIINEEGKLDGLPINAIATIIYQRIKKINDVIVGNAIICDKSFIN